jgi:hypothetical protein
MKLGDLLEDDVVKKVKVFSSSGIKPCETVQNDINDWLADQGDKVTIFDIKQSVVAVDLGMKIIISVWYMGY